MAKMAKSLSERIAERMKAREPSGPGKNRAAFLALRGDVKTALDDGWPVKVIWETLYEEGKITFKYDAFIGYVERLIRTVEAPAPPAAPGAAKGDKPKPATKGKQADQPNTEKSPLGGFNFDATVNKEQII
jgi:hypothetical protein